MLITITEALAEIKTIGKRIEKKREFVGGYLSRHEGLKDPLERDGGSFKAIENERQSIRDLESRIVSLRRGIQTANEKTAVTLAGSTRTVADWLVWRREIAPGYQQFLAGLRVKLAQIRAAAQKGGSGVFSAGQTPEKPTDVVVNINEADLAKEIEALEDILGQLDGQLSLRNATVVFEA